MATWTTEIHIEGALEFLANRVEKHGGERKRERRGIFVSFFLSSRGPRLIGASVGSIYPREGNALSWDN